MATVVGDDTPLTVPSPRTVPLDLARIVRMMKRMNGTIDTTVAVPLHAMAMIRKAMDRAIAADRRHATRLGLEVPAAPELVVGEQWQVRQCNACGFQSRDASQWLSVCCTSPARLLTMVNVTITAPRPTCGAWELMAVVEGQPLDFEGKPSLNLLRRIPGSTEGHDLAAYRAGDAGRCDHCDKIRRRNETFLVLSLETGEIKQVGRQCLAAFLGDKSYETIIRRLAWLELLVDDRGPSGDEGEGGGGRWGDPEPDIETVLALTAAVIRNDGWVSKTAARDRSDLQATADQVYALINPPRGAEAIREWKAEVARLAPQPADMEHAQAALSWVRSMSPRSDYEWSIYTAGRLTTVEHMGIVCSIVSAYDRVIGREVEQRTKRASMPASVHVGQVGEKVAVTGTVERVHAMSGEWGTTTAITVVSPDGVVVEWMKSGIVDEVLTGLTVTMTGKVKRHGEYKGRAVTTLTRCRIEVAPKVEAKDKDECATCDGHGTIKDGETGDRRRCLDCGGEQTAASL